MKLKLARAITAGMAVMAVTGVSPVRATTALVDFENNPSLATGPSTVVAAPGPQTIVTPEATFSGGVVLGNATFFPAIAFATPPNVYGTANFSGNGLLRQLTIDINPAFPTTEVSFALFNGQTFTSYIIDAFNGLNLVASQTLTNVAPNFNSGYGLVDLLNLGGITSVTIAPTGAPAVWDFLIDTVAFNQNITSVVPPPVFQPPVPPVVVPVQPHGHHHNGEGHEGELVQINFGDDINDIRGSLLVVPEPETYAMMLVGLGLLGFIAIRRKLEAA